MGTADDKLSSMRAGGAHLARIRSDLMAMIRSGIDLMAIEYQARERIKQIGAIPSFALVSDYGFATCIMVNDEVVHCRPRHYILRKGDLLTVDIGLEWRGWQLDSADSRLVGREDDHFLSVGRQALKQAVSMARPGRRIGHISRAMQRVIEKNGYSAVRKYCGHGIGREIHEDPQIPCALERPIEQTPRLVAGMTLAIEVMMNEGGFDVVVSPDGWHSRTADGSRSAQFEHTVLVAKPGPEILT